MSIKQLPEDVIEKIKSSVAIISLNDVIVGLLKNSLDAGSTKVNVSLDCSKGSCSIEDDGHGILPSEFLETGGLAKIHHTSRHPPRSSQHGRRGDFIAAVASLSLLSITSKHCDHRSHNSLLVHNGRTLSRHCPAPPEQRFFTSGSGTRVMVHDLFGSMPVRVKQRGIIAAESSVLSREWLQLVQEVTSVAMAWPSEVTVIVRERSGDRHVRLVGQAPDLTSRTKRLLLQAGLTESIDAGTWVPVSASTSLFSVTGCISTTPSPSQRCQFISIGVCPISDPYGTNLLYQEVNQIFKNSSFCMEEPDGKGQTDSNSGGFDFKLRKRASHWPKFYLSIEHKGMDQASLLHDVQAESTSPALTSIIKLLQTVSYGFLKSYHFQPRKLGQDSNANAPMSREPKRARTSVQNSSRSGSPDVTGRAQSLFDGWSRGKVGLATARKARFTTLAQRTSKEKLIGYNGQVLRRPFEEISIEPSHLQGGITGLQVDDGNGSQNHSKKGPGDSARGCRKPPSEWLREVIQSWENPVFGTAEPGIPQAYDESTGEHSHHWGSDAGQGVMFESASMAIKRRLSKSSLSDAEVISQVDRKFILVKVPGLDSQGSPQPSATTLVMLDQHAVDERCQLEKLLRAYFVGDDNGIHVAGNELLEKSLSFDISEQEFRLLQDFQGHFAYWGIIYKTSVRKTAPTGEAYTVQVTNLPPSIMERCRTEPRLLVDILRQEIWRLHDGGVPARPRKATVDSDHPWISLFHGCPKGILELLHSRSCRSAIMFNDVLDKTQCEDLIRRLGDCAFPFQCAHGRPSIAPILDMGSAPRMGGWEDEESGQDISAIWKSYSKA